MPSEARERPRRSLPLALAADAIPAAFRACSTCQVDATSLCRRAERRHAPSHGCAVWRPRPGLVRGLQLFGAPAVRERLSFPVSSPAVR